MAVLSAADEKRLEDVRQRLAAANEVFTEVMKVDDKAIPRELLEGAQCAVIVPGLKKGALVVGAQYGKGFISCRSAAGARNWSAPAAVRVEGGSFGLQIGGGETDLVLLVMNEESMRGILESEFKFGGTAGVMAGPVGRVSQAEIDGFFRSGMIGWSRARGLFAGLALTGSTLREDKEDNMALYGREVSNKEIVTGSTRTPAVAQPLIASLSRYAWRARQASAEKK